jgi:ankyrin repeat protein
MKTLLVAVLLALPAFAADARVAEAAAAGDRDTALTLIKAKADVNGAQGDGMTALHWAAMHDDLELARALLANGANPQTVTRLGGVTPLLLAAKSGSAALVQALLQSGASVKQADQLGVTPLMMAAASGNAEVVKALVAGGADVNATESAHGQTALMFAAAYNRAGAVKALLAAGGNAKAYTQTSDPGCGSTFNRNACDETDEVVNPVAPPKRDTAKDKVSEPTPKKEDTEATKEPKRRRGAAITGGMTPLLFAARDGQMEAAKALVEGGADVNDAGLGEKMTPLVIAIANGHYDLAMYFLEHKADPNPPSDSGLTALYAAIDMQWAPYAWYPQPITAQEKTSYLELMKALIAKGANVNARLGRRVWFRALVGDSGWVDQAGATAFWRAAQSNDLAAMKLLVANGADPELATTAGSTPLMVTAGVGWAMNFSRNAPNAWMDSVKFCLEHGNDVNAADARGYTALHGAAFRGDNELINFLMSKGAKIDAKTKAGDTVADMANGPIPHSIPHPETVALLEKLGSANSHNCRSDQCLIAPTSQPKQ